MRKLNTGQICYSFILALVRDIWFIYISESDQTFPLSLRILGTDLPLVKPLNEIVRKNYPSLFHGSLTTQLGFCVVFLSLYTRYCVCIFLILFVLLKYLVLSLETSPTLLYHISTWFGRNPCKADTSERSKQLLRAVTGFLLIWPKVSLCETSRLRDCGPVILKYCCVKQQVLRKFIFWI